MTAAETLNHLQRLTGCGVNYRSFTEQYLDSTVAPQRLGRFAAVAFELCMSRRARSPVPVSSIRVMVYRANTFAIFSSLESVS
jgi:hypothetical protein